MHRMSGRLCALVALVLAAFLAPSARAGDEGGPDPEAIAAHCIQVVTQAATHRAAWNEQTAATCVEHIETLLEEGHPAAAVHLAQHCIHAINHRSFNTVQRIQHRTAHCVHVLMALEAPELAQQVLAAGQAAVQQVAASRQAAVQSIQDALP